MGSKRYPSQPSTRRDSYEDGGAFEKFELYVPKEAEVIVVPEEALPLSIRSRVSSVHSAKRAGGGVAAVSGRLATWISPVVIQEREAQLGDSSSSQDDGLARARLHSAVAACAALRHHCWLPITCAHLAAFNVLRDFLPLGQGHQPRKERQGVLSESTPLPPGRTLRFTRDSIIIHGGRIFLSIKNSAAALKRNHGRPVPLQDSSPLTVIHCQDNFQRSPGTRQSRKKPCATAASVQPCSMAGVKPQDTLALLQKFGISQEVRVTLRRLPEIHRGCRGDWQLGPVMDPNDQMLPSSGSSIEESGSCINVKDFKSESLEEHCAVFDQSDPVEEKHWVDNEEQDTRQPVLKKTRLSHPSVLGSHEGKGGDKRVDEENDGDVNRTGHGEEDSDLGQEEVIEDGQEVARGDDGDCVKHECEIKSDETVNWASHSPDRSHAGELPSYLVTSRLEDHAAFDFEQLARQERINRIREMIREKEAALRSLEPPS